MSSRRATTSKVRPCRTLDVSGPELPASAPAKTYQLLARVFAVDVLRCDKCGGRRKLTAFIVASREACDLLEQLGIDATAPPTAPARGPPRQLE